MVAAMVLTQEVCWLWAGVGAVILDTGVLALKSMLQHPRPASEPLFVMDSEGPYGMPSEHAAFASFLLSFFASLAECSSVGPGRLPPVAKYVALSILGLWAAAVVTLRYITGAHSFWQLAAGGALGLAAGLAWYKLLRLLVVPLERVQLAIHKGAKCLNIMYLGDHDHGR